MTKGVFLTDREIFEKKLWQNILDFRLFFFLYGSAVWNDNGAQVGTVFVGRGQFLRSYRQLQDDLAYVENNKKMLPPLESVRRSIKRLELDGRLRTACTELGTLFTITNYQYYQGFERFYSAELGTGLGTGLGQAWDNKNKGTIKDKELSSPPPSGERGKGCKFSQAHLAVAQLLRNKITARKPDFKFTAKLEAWANDVRLMVERDGRSIERIKAVIIWAQADGFWRDNILSVAKLREQFDKLELRMSKAPINGRRQQEPSTEELLAGFDIQQ